jgi:thymidylate synthase
VHQYLDILRKAMKNGVDRDDRTGTGTRAIFGEVMRFRMSDGFPAVTTKRLAFRSVLAELLWFIAGSSDVNELHALGVHIWDGNANAPYWTPKARFDGDAGRNYGQQWRDWIAPNGDHIDQLRDVITACHAFFQFFVAPGVSPMEEAKLSVMMYQRSCDLFLGVPFNVAQYAVLLHLVAQFTGLVPDEFVHVLADAHIYRDHMEGVRQQLAREPYASPRLALDPSLGSLDDVVARYREIVARARAGDKPGPMLDSIARLEQYQFHPPIEAKMAV